MSAKVIIVKMKRATIENRQGRNKMNTFVVTACEDTGLRFLSKVLNRSDNWDVRYNSRISNKDENSLKNGKIPRHISQRIARASFRGEVNPNLIWTAFDIPADRIGVVVRDPINIWLSAANQSPPNDWKEILSDIKDKVGVMLETASIPEVLTIDFNQMTSDPTYLLDVGQYLGVYDISTTSEDTLVKEFEQLSPPIKDLSFFSGDIVRDVKEMSRDFHQERTWAIT
jgi:hypothetical protein